MAGYFAQNLVLFDTFACIFLVGNGIARTAVHESVITAGGAVGQVLSLKQ